MLTFVDLQRVVAADREDCIELSTTEAARFFNITAQRRGAIGNMGQVVSHFLDSGAFSLQSTAAEWADKKGRPISDFWNTKQFWRYCDAYAEFVKKYQIGIDLYANLDVIGNPELTYRNQMYLESKGLRPVPVVHFGTDLKWLRRYVRDGYDLIGLGGLVGKRNRTHWLDRAFDELPKNTRVHGFGVTDYQLILRYPWFSIDSTAWVQISAFGGILVPRYRSGRFRYEESAHLIKISEEKTEIKSSLSYARLAPAEKKVVLRWLDLIGVPLEGDEEVKGVKNCYIQRRKANLIYFEKLENFLSERSPLRQGKSLEGLLTW